jgi:hypothetical protein
MKAGSVVSEGSGSAQIAVASLHVKAAKSCFCARFLQIVQILKSIPYADSEAYG